MAALPPCNWADLACTRVFTNLPPKRVLTHQI